MYVLKQYEESDKDFAFLGVFPIDFAIEGVCQLNRMCDFSLKKLQAQNKKKFAMVLNLDKHNEPGSHWVAVFCSIDMTSPQYGFCYFDSVSGHPPSILNSFFKDLSNQFKDLGPKHVVKYNPTQKQFGGSECGVFSIFFIVACLKNPRLSYRKVRSLIKTSGNDSTMNKFRNIFWRP
jgi:hypothetical protein